MSDDRPRPEYGEYATPEEQAAAIGTVPEAMQDITPQAVVAPVAPVTSGRRWDIVFSIALVVFGAYVTFTNLAVNFQSTIEEAYTSYGYTGTYSNPTLATAVGIALNIVRPVALLIAVFFTARRLRAGRVSFWVPLVAGAVVTIITAVLLVVVILSDPKFMDFFQKSMGV